MSEWLSLIQVVILAITLLLTASISALVFRQTRNHFMVLHSHDFIERFNSHEMVEHRALVNVWIEAGAIPDALSDGASPVFEEETTIAIRTFLNFFQELGVALAHDAVNVDYVWDVFGSIVYRYWEDLRPYVDRRRAARPSLFSGFEDLAKAMARIDPKRGVTRTPTSYVFGYGSLMNTESIERTIGPLPEARGAIPCWLEGYRREWNVWDGVRLDDGDEEVRLAFLGVVPDVGARCNGILLKVTEHDLTALDARERSYDRVDVTNAIGFSAAGTVYTYVSKPAYTILPPDAMVSRRYLDTVERGTARWGEEFERDFRASTSSLALPEVDGTYAFVKPHPDPVASV